MRTDIYLFLSVPMHLSEGRWQIRDEFTQRRICCEFWWNFHRWLHWNFDAGSGENIVNMTFSFQCNAVHSQYLSLTFHSRTFEKHLIVCPWLCLLGLKAWLKLSNICGRFTVWNIVSYCTVIYHEPRVIKSSKATHFVTGYVSQSSVEGPLHFHHCHLPNSLRVNVVLV